jgi:hypothetical protein
MGGRARVITRFLMGRVSIVSLANLDSFRNRFDSVEMHVHVVGASHVGYHGLEQQKIETGRPGLEAYHPRSLSQICPVAPILFWSWSLNLSIVLRLRKRR